MERPLGLLSCVDVRRWVWRCMALAGLAWALASCAAAPSAPAVSPAYVPLSRSALVVVDDSRFLAARQQDGTVSTTVLAWSREGAAPQAVARLLQVRQDSGLLVAVEHVQSARRSALTQLTELATLEQLYALVFRLEPDARFCWVVVPRLTHPFVDPPACDAASGGVTQAQLLHGVARARFDRALGSTTRTPWHVVELARGPTPPWDADLVAVRVTANEQPVPDLAIHFNRAPHSMCVARTQPDGVAVCRLQDQHGDGHQHDHATAVVATFPGDLQAQRVLLPTTAVLPALASRYPFSRPFPHAASMSAPTSASMPASKP